jgi:hypothetical protein
LFITISSLRLLLQAASSNEYGARGVTIAKRLFGVDAGWKMAYSGP